METQMKQRLAGILVLLVLIAAIVFLLLYGTKSSSRNNAQKPVEETKMQLALPSDDAKAEISALPETSLEAPMAKDTAQPVEVSQQSTIPDHFGQVNDDKGANLGNPDEAADAAASSVVPLKNAVIKRGANMEINPMPPTPLDASSKANTNNKSKAAGLSSKKTAKVKANKLSHKKHASLQVKNKQKIRPKQAWSVQLASFSSSKNAQKFLKKLHSKGYHGYARIVKSKSHGVLTQVLIGPVPSKAEAKRLAITMQKQFKVKGLVVHHSKMKTNTKMKIKKKTIALKHHK